MSDTRVLVSDTGVTSAQAHRALVAGFIVLGAIDGVWVARLPALKHQLSLDSGRLGIVVFAASLGATLSLPFAGWLAARFGSRGPLALGLGLALVALALAAFAPTLLALVAIAAVLGVGLGITDISANAHGVELERRLGRKVLSPLHAAWSFGLLGGSAVTALAAAAGIFVEFAAMNWSAVFLNGPAGASAAVAATAVVCYAGAMGVARLFGDRLLARWGIGGLALRSGSISCAGMLLAIGTRSTVPALVGFALVGVGCAAIVPALFRVGGSAPGIAQGAGIAAVATAGYSGALVNGPAIGFIARGVGLSAALGLVAAAGAVIALLGPRLGSAQ